MIARATASRQKWVVKWDNLKFRHWLRGKRRENSPIICKTLILVFFTHSSMAFSSFVTLLLKFYSHCLGVFFTFTLKKIYLWVDDCWSLQFISPSACQSASQPDNPGLHLKRGWEGRGVDVAQGVPLHTKGEQGRHDSLMTLAFVYHIILPIICISFMWDFVLQRKMSSLLA